MSLSYLSSRGPLARAWLRRAGSALLCLALARSAHAQQTARLIGTVHDAKTGAAIPDAAVTVRGSGRRVQSDVEGKWFLAGLPAGSVTLTIQRLGYAPRTVDVNTRAGIDTRVDVLLEATVQVIAPVVVSGTREAQNQRESSVTIGALDGTEIREARAAHPAAIAQRIPGVHISQLSGEGHSTAIRQPITTKPLYLYLEDGVPTRSTGFFNHNALYEVNLPQAGGMEILKGPGTALHGSDAIGGVINVLTRPAPATPSLDLTMEVGAYGYRRMLGTGGFTHGSQGLRADLNLTRADGFKQNAPYDRWSATLRHDAILGNVSLKTVLTATNVDQHDVVALPTSDFNSRPEVNRSPIAFRDVQALRWSTAIEREQGSTLWSVTPFARHNVLGLLPSWQLSFDPEVWDTRNNSLGVLAKYRRDFAPARTRVIAGVDVDYSPGSARSDGIAAVKAGPDSAWTTYTKTAAHYDYDVTYFQTSPYVHVEVSPLARLRLDAGLRYDHSGYDYDNLLTPLATGRWRRPADTTLSFARWSPKVGLTFDVNKDLNVYASYREGFRAPAQSQLFQQGSNLNTVGLDPVTARSAEVGVRGTLAGRVLYQLSAYDMRIENDILSVLDPNGIRTSSNAGATRHHGIETAIGAALAADLRLDLAWSASKQKYVDWVIPVQTQNVSYAGRTIEVAPSTLGNALLTWSPRLLNGGRLAAEWSHTGRYFMDPENTRKYDGFDLWTLHANYRVHRGGEVFARVTNLADTRYAEIVTYGAFTREQFTPGNPRTVYAGLRWSWQQ
ncbi:MAG TPA: TonB-dependent receptor [Gemmatimonadaceae bacterium]|jgi:outer membrane receptor protein involved in Fe transport